MVLFCAGLSSCQQDVLSGGSFDDEDVGLPGGDPGPIPGGPPINVSQVRINEIMVANTATIADETGAFSPWLELYNPTDLAVDLSGVSLSDDVSAAEKWVLPGGAASVVPPHGYIVIFCDGRASELSGLHTSFTLKPGPLDLVLNKGSDLFIAEGSAISPDQSLGRFPDGGEKISVLNASTPGAANAAPISRGEGIRGDVDRSGEVDLTDVIDILRYLFQGTFTPHCEPVADANDDGIVNITDAVGILAFLFLGDPALPDLSAEDLAACIINEPPIVTPRPVYLTYPGYPVEFPIEATDPEGERLGYEAIDLPPGATLEEPTGIVRWTPTAEQLGPFYLTFAVSDGAVPPHRVGGRLVFQVHPLDGCTRPQCDPARGCEPNTAPLGESCCGTPAARVSDPEVGCPAGGVLHVGRNPLGSATIGRVENCDLLQLLSLGQGGHTLRLNFEVRCLVPNQILVEARLETAEEIFFDESARRDFVLRADGYSQLLRFSFAVEGFSGGNTEAQLTVAATDSDGVRLERKLRLILTDDPVPELP